MYKLCKTEQSAKRQKEIEELFLALLEMKSYEDVTVSELCERAGMPRKAFYRYFDTKEDVILALIDHTLAGYDSYVQKSTKSVGRTVASELESFFAFWLDGDARRLLVAVIKNSLEGHLIQRSINFSVSEMPSIRRFMSSDVEDSAMLIFRFVITGLMSVTLSWFKDGCKESPHDMASVVQRLVAEPIFPNLETYGIMKK